jgi:hypothetical protein
MISKPLTEKETIMKKIASLEADIEKRESS